MHLFLRVPSFPSPLPLKSNFLAVERGLQASCLVAHWYLRHQQEEGCGRNVWWHCAVVFV